MNYFQRVHMNTPTRFWVNNVTRKQARLAIAAGAVGCTQNPAYLSKVIGSADDGEWIDGIIGELLSVFADDNELVCELQRRVIAGICVEFLPLYELGGGCGYVSIQADPFRETADVILDNADKCLRMMPNFIIKIPATKHGIVAIAELIKRRVPVLATEVMSMDQVIELLELHKGLTIDMTEPAPFYFAHINGIFDAHLEDVASRDGLGISAAALRCASFALARRIQQLMDERNYKALYLAGGARGLHHFTDMVGVNGGVTINWTGTADRLIELDGEPGEPFLSEIEPGLVEELLDKVEDFRKAYVPGSLLSEEYESFGPVVKFRDMFEEGWLAAREYVRARRAAGRP